MKCCGHSLPRIPRIPKRFADFPVCPGLWRQDRSLCFRVMIFDKHEEMKAAYRKLSADCPQHEDFGAVTMPMVVQRLERGKWTTSPILGFMLMSCEQLDNETVSHESVHMAIEYLRRTEPKALRLLKECGEREESLAYSVGECVGQITSQLAKTEMFK